MSEQGIWTVSGPSGGGKTTLVGNLLELEPVTHLSPLVRVTTRQPRPNDNANEYEYVTDKEYDQRRMEGLFLWPTEIHGVRHAVMRHQVDAALVGEGVVIADLAPFNVENVMQYANDRGKVGLMRSIYLDLPDEEELHRRMEERSERDVERRIVECRGWGEYARASFVPFHIIDARKTREEVLRLALQFYLSH